MLHTCTHKLLRTQRPQIDRCYSDIGTRCVLSTPPPLATTTLRTSTKLAQPMPPLHLLPISTNNTEILLTPMVTMLSTTQPRNPSHVLRLHTAPHLRKSTCLQHLRVLKPIHSNNELHTPLPNTSTQPALALLLCLLPILQIPLRMLHLPLLHILITHSLRISIILNSKPHHTLDILPLLHPLLRPCPKRRCTKIYKDN